MADFTKKNEEPNKTNTDFYVHKKVTRQIKTLLKMDGKQLKTYLEE